MTVFDTLLAPIMPILQQIEAGRKKHHNETFLWIDFVRVLVFYFTRRCGSRNAFIVALENADPALAVPHVPAMTLSDAFRRFPPSLFRQALTSVITSLTLPENPELALIGRVCAADGSDFPIVGGMLLPQSTELARSMKLHLIFNLNQLITADFLVDHTDSSERSALRKMLQAGVTYILDRGSMAFDLLRDIIAAQAFVVMRAYNNIVVETVTELPVVLPDSFTAHWIQVRDRIVQSAHPDAAGMLFRLVECTVGTTTYRLITNRTDLTTFQVIILYAYRWQIEIVFTQMTKGRGFPRRTGWQHVPDLDLAVRDDDAVDQQFDQLSALGEIQVFQGRLKALAERGDSFRQFGHIDLALRLGVQLAQLLRQPVLGLLHLLSFALEFGAADNFGQVGIQQAGLLAVKLGQGILDGLPTGLERLRQPLAHLRPRQFVADQGRLGQHLTEVVPDQIIQGGRRDVAGRTARARGRP